ncbi:MAG TPA: isochorismatase family cysteine hydrolase [Dongiaceae bacterium]|jgi:nicotinamidase-related amidase|nr:isochorismatase family cysteine hydrolase [Dongiaceae bacterium]
MQRKEDTLLTRERPFEAKRSCLLLIDTQNYVWNPDVAKQVPYFDHQVREVVLPNLRRLIDTFRGVGAEVMYTVMENYTKDGRDRSLDYKLSKFFIAKGSWEAKVLDAIAPGGDDIVLPKTSSGVFNSTNIEYLLRNIGIDTLVVTGFLTDQCVDHTVRDSADRGFYPVCVSDACATHSEARHENALKAFAGYCRTMTTTQLVATIKSAAR